MTTFISNTFMFIQQQVATDPDYGENKITLSCVDGEVIISSVFLAILGVSGVPKNVVLEVPMVDVRFIWSFLTDIKGRKEYFFGEVSYVYFS